MKMPESAPVSPIALWGIDEAAEALGVSSKTLRRWATTGYGPRARRIGLKRVYRYVPDECLAWLARVSDEDTIEIRPQRRVA